MKIVELAPSGFDLKSFPRQSQSRGGGIATVCKSILSSNITFKTNIDFTHTLFKVVQASITLQHNTLHFTTLTKHTLTTLSLHNFVQAINKPTHKCSHSNDWVLDLLDDDIHKKYTVTDSLESDHYCNKSDFNVLVSKSFTFYLIQDCKEHG